MFNLLLQFTIRKQGSGEANTYTTNKQGIIDLTDLEAGTYEIREISAPSFIDLDAVKDKIWKVNVADNQNGQALQITNNIKKHKNQPLTPLTPSKKVIPWTPMTPSKKVIPWTPLTPAKKVIPWTPMTPSKKVIPWTPMTPSKKVIPWTPLTPSKKVIPWTPLTPSTKVIPWTPMTPSTKVIPWTPLTPAKSVVSEAGKPMTQAPIFKPKSKKSVIRETRVPKSRDSYTGRHSSLKEMSNRSKGKQELLPQTGQQNGIFLGCLGFIMLLIAGQYLCKKVKCN